MVLYATLPYGVNENDKIHLTTQGYVDLGRQIARHLVAAEQSGKMTSPGPMVSDARFAGADHRTIVARFKNGAGLTGGATNAEWFVTDAGHQGFRDGGFVPITRVEVNPEAARVTITLAEPAGDAALSYGYNCNLVGTLRNADGVPAPAVVKVSHKP